mgnify:FL=1
MIETNRELLEQTFRANFPLVSENQFYILNISDKISISARINTLIVNNKSMEVGFVSEHCQIVIMVKKTESVVSQKVAVKYDNGVLEFDNFFRQICQVADLSN